MTTQQRVAFMRAKDTRHHKRTIEVKLSVDEVKILDALASNAGMSRVLFTSNLLKKFIFHSPYFLRHDGSIASSR